jgi:polyisoprenoid-binding protein YceI
MRTKWLLIGLTLAGRLFGQTLVMEIDPANTRIGYTLGDVLHTVHGTFRLKSGQLRIDPKTGAASGSLIVDATSGDSGSAARDSRMLKNVLETDKYPEITFAPDRVIGKVNLAGASEIELHGVFTIHGAPHELTMPVYAEIARDHIDATAQFPVPYIKWGMKNPSTLFLRVKDTVQIEMRVSGKVVPAPTSDLRPDGVAQAVARSRTALD